MTAYYNEFNKYAAQWLRNLIDAGHIAPGYVDERSIEDVKPADLVGFTQCHFFAGIGIWSLSLRLAGWPDKRQVWTGSCPCQPFSSAGKGSGFDDQRHLWPHFQWLIQQCKPTDVLGEQVASKDAEPWIDLVHADMEAMGYVFGCVPFPSASVGAPHMRDRNFWVGHANGEGLERHPGDGCAEGWEGQDRPASSAGLFGELANTTDFGQHGRGTSKAGDGRNAAWLESERLRDVGGKPPTCATNGFWADADWLFCRDGKWRPVEPGTCPLAHGATNRVGRLRAYGNAINAQAAKVFIKSYMEAVA